MAALNGTGILIVIIAIILLLILAVFVIILIEILLWLLRESRRPILAQYPSTQGFHRYCSY